MTENRTPSTDTDDVEGHMPLRRDADASGHDTEGHGRRLEGHDDQPPTDAEDTEGHGRRF